MSATTFRVTAEHEARELLNLALMLERCLGLPDATADEQAEWRFELSDARRRLEDLLSPGRESAMLTRRLTALAARSHYQGL
jgi:hypothetical protein